MTQDHFHNLEKKEQDWIDSYVDGTITLEDFQSLQNHMRTKPLLRKIMRRYLALDHALQEESETQAKSLADPAINSWLETAEAGHRRNDSSASKVIQFSRFWPTGIAAGLAFLLGLGLMNWNSQRRLSSTIIPPAPAEREADKAEGFAVVGRLFDTKWPDSKNQHREGDTLAAENFHLSSGTAEIHFYSGAIMTVAGPSEISLKSAWEASCLEGTVRMRVPPAARGFKLNTPSTKIIDLGTEFGLQIRDGKGHVEVFDGEIALTHKGEEKQILEQGKAVGLNIDGPSFFTTSGKISFPDAKKLGSRARLELANDFAKWQSHRDTLARDKRLLAYYTFDQANRSSSIKNLLVPRDPNLDGAVILTEVVSGRWPGLKSALEFRRPGSRVRVNIPGEFSAFTFMAWVRIDSLDRLYNALFMADSYETGEPHWQIQDDGRMILSVMINDSRPHPKLGTKRHNYLYFSPPIWDLSMSGQWLHLASVFDPEHKNVRHYVNGEKISEELIAQKNWINTLRIGNAEIGNWGQPFREDPSFAIRNLNGRMDEIAIFREALDHHEVLNLYERSRSNRQ